MDRETPPHIPTIWLSLKGRLYNLNTKLQHNLIIFFFNILLAYPLRALWQIRQRQEFYNPGYSWPGFPLCPSWGGVAWVTLLPSFSKSSWGTLSFFCLQVSYAMDMANPLPSPAGKDSPCLPTWLGWEGCGCPEDARDFPQTASVEAVKYLTHNLPFASTQIHTAVLIVHSSGRSWPWSFCCISTHLSLLLCPDSTIMKAITPKVGEGFWGSKFLLSLPVLVGQTVISLVFFGLILRCLINALCPPCNHGLQVWRKGVHVWQDWKESVS